MRTLIFCFDGTWNGRDDKIPTNVLQLHRALNVDGQVSFYFAGPGNEDESNFFEEIFGGAFGLGSSQIRDRALDVLSSAYRPEDRIAAVGFSRGAAVARMFCSKLSSDGVNDQYPTVDFLGCFDTVGAFLPFGHGQQGTLFHDLHVASNVQRAYHAVALDEVREAFEPNLMNKAAGITEVWFPGGHSDVGGGNNDDGLSDGALKWMVERLAENEIRTEGLSFMPDPTAPMTLPRMLRNGPRRVGVKVNGVWSDLQPVYHESVIERMRADVTYRPSIEIEDQFKIDKKTDSGIELSGGKPVMQGYDEINPETGQQKGYVVLTADERAKGFMRPVRTTYKHVGPSGPTLDLRDLNDEERERYAEFGYVKFEEYPESKSSATGRYWTQAQLDKIGGGCGAVTTMAQDLAETYAREPKFYGGTFCANCREHFPVDEFVWDGTDERVGS